MAKLHELESHLASLTEIRSIMASMKTLALMETRKLARRSTTQTRVTRAIETVAADFAAHFPLPPTTPDGADAAARVCVLFGSERGFCGDFNETLLQRHHDEVARAPSPAPLLIGVGQRLCNKLPADDHAIAHLAGANVAEEVERVLNALVDRVNDLADRYGSVSLTVIHHSSDGDTPRLRHVLPPFRQLSMPAPKPSHPPSLNLSPNAFLADLIEHYLFAILHDVAIASLMAENRRRMEHLEAAVTMLDHKAGVLAMKRNVLRQEEITEELEVIMLSVESTLPGAWSPDKPRF